MSGSPLIVLDTNVVLYHLGSRLIKPLEKQRYVVSIITEIELLSYPKIQPAEIKSIASFIERVTVIELRDSIKELSIPLRREYNLKVPDAIIAATALRLNAPLLTNDQKLLNIPELDAQSVDFV